MFFHSNIFMNVYDKIKKSYKSGKQVWACSEKPLENTIEISHFIKDNITKYTSISKSAEEGNINKFILWQSIPDYLITTGITTESGDVIKGISIDYSSMPKKLIKKSFVPYRDGSRTEKKISDEIIENLIKSSKEEIKKKQEAIKSISPKILEEIILRKSIIHELPDPKEWVEKTYKLHENDPYDKIRFSKTQRLLRKLKGERQTKIFTDMFSELEGQPAKFLLEYFGDKKISKNIFLIVSSTRIPEYENKNWELLLI